MRQRKVLVLLDKSDFERLAEAARASDRETYQEASYLLKHALRRIADQETEQGVAECGN